MPRTRVTAPKQRDWPTAGTERWRATRPAMTDSHSMMAMAAV